MLAFSLLRYWWMRPQAPDPLVVDPSMVDPLKSVSIPSLLEPACGPQLEYTKNKWSKVSHFYGGRDPLLRAIVEIEQAIADGKDMILVEPVNAGSIYYIYVSHGWLLLEGSISDGLCGLVVAYLKPNWWYIYAPFTCLSFIHSWVYFRVYKYDRVSEYQAYDDDRHPISNLITAWILGQRPEHFQYVLKKLRVLPWEILSHIVLGSSLVMTLLRWMEIEEKILGVRVTPGTVGRESLLGVLHAPAYLSGYFQPIELVSAAHGKYLPSNIPLVGNWFNLPWLKIRMKPIRADLFVIAFGLGAYFLYKAIEHFSTPKDEESDELGREWSTNEDAQKVFNRCQAEDPYHAANPYWISKPEDVDDLHKLPLKPKTDVEIKEQNEITRLANTVPYGFVKPGYVDNHYGVFT